MKGKLFEKTLYYITVLLFLIFSLGPIIWSIIISITPESEMFNNSINILPTNLYFGNYIKILQEGTSANQAVFGGIKNSLKISLLTISMGLPISVISGYAFSRYKFKRKNFILRSILLTIVIPVFSTIIPIYSFFSKYGLLDSLFWTSVIYVSAFLPINTWIVMIYFNSLPKELWEAAKVDGCNEFQTFYKIILPISYPIMITSALMLFLMSWNQFQLPLILISSQKNKVITTVLSEFVSRDAISYGLISVSGLFAIIPPALMAIMFRKFLISGLTSGAVKG